MRQYCLDCLVTAWSGERFVAVGGWTDAMVHSPDGELWQDVSRRGGLYGLDGIAWAGDRSWP